MILRKNILATACLLALTGCNDTAVETGAGADNLGSSSIGTINGKPIPESVFRKLGLNSIQKRAEDMTPEERAAVIDQLVTLELVAADGLADNIDSELTVAADLELLRLQFLANATVERYLERNPPSESLIRDLYDERTQSLSGTEYKARHILVETEDEARRIIGQLDAGGDFAALAEEFTTDPSGRNSGGDLGWFSPNAMVEPFAAAVQQVEAGSYSAAPVQTQFGWHVILVEDTRAQQPPGIESMRRELENIARRQQIENYIESLREAAVVAVE
jgi:peptidyl-prolyl cis-trans isomerase C